jgi:DNA-binding NarL/FixJ family response regulator
VTPTIRVLLVEDNEAYRDSLAFLLGLREGIEVAGGVATGHEAAAACRELGVEVAVVDLRLPDIGGVEAADDVRGRCPHTAVVFLSASAGERDTTHLAGRRLVRKDEGVDALVQAIVEAAGNRFED